MEGRIGRREFVRGSFAVSAGLASRLAHAKSPGERAGLAIAGVNSRGADLARGFCSLPNAEVLYVCDPDRRAAARCAAEVAKKQARAPRAIPDFRNALVDRSVDALVIAAPDHWHAPATLLACAAGKHVYCEKPACHNPHEGDLMVAAARKHNRVVQLGTQRRSMAGVIEAIDKLRAGAIGRVLFARGWYNNTRPSIGHGHAAPVPDWLDYSLWQGPAPERPFRDNLVHYNWHWWWNWGTGELGNNGIHALDVCRWGLGADYPRRVTAGGGKYRWDDDQETPDTLVVTYDFGDKAISWEGRSWHPRGFEGSQFGIAFYGEQGTMVIDGANYRVLDLKEREVSRGSGPGSDSPHLANFLDCVRGAGKPNAPIEEGVKSTLLCHLGNIAWRTGHTLSCDARTGRPQNDPAASALWQREYRPGWQPRV